ncbi:hypothetical protein F5Y05DRAFT_362107 [Hypoxylon sp. FL0543]|nr:hypothetical protein F5Y05DRAFT_362107 [Hypoxylon sp. FL0543]
MVKAQVRGTTLRKEAKAMTVDRRKRKEKHRLLRQWICDMHQSKVARKADQTVLDESDSDASAEPPTCRSEGQVWDQPAHIKGLPASYGLTLGTMLQIAKDCYKLAAKDFDKMDLYDHMCYIQAIRFPETPTAETLVDKALVVMGQQQLQLAKDNYIACVARMAVLSNMSKDVRADMKTCRNCLQKFLPGSEKPCTCDKDPKSCGRAKCRYHWGELRSYNDGLGPEERGLGEDFLTRGNVKLREFKLWIGTCFWSCCGGKLEDLDPDAGKRSQRKKKQPLEKWEIGNPYDGSVGCEPPGPQLLSAVPPEVLPTTAHHVAFPEPAGEGIEL